MRKKSKHHRFSTYLFCNLIHPVNNFLVADMHAIKRADGDYCVCKRFKFVYRVINEQSLLSFLFFPKLEIKTSLVIFFG